MPVRFAVASGNWSDPAIWDNGAVPLDGDDVYANGFTITIDQNINVLKFTNRQSLVRVPSLVTPQMTSDTTPSGVAFASSFRVGGNPYFAFDLNTSTAWSSNTTNNGILGYQFPLTKTIKQYLFLTTAGGQFNPYNWTFQGSNDGTSYTTLETVTAFSSAPNTWYTRSLASNTGSFTYYRMNITQTAVITAYPVIAELQMSESTGSVYATGSGGFFISTNNIQITASNPAFGVVSANSGVAFLITGSNTVYMSGSIQGNDVTSGGGAVRITNGGTLYITGSISSGVGGGGVTDNFGLLISSGSAFIQGNLRTNGDAGNTAGACVFINNGTASIVGDLYSATNHAPIAIGAGNAQVNFFGSAFIQGTSTGNMQVQMRAANNGVLNYNGPVIGNNNAGIGLGFGTMTVNITGSVSTIGAAAGISSTVASTINVNGPITANNSAPGLSSTSTAATVRVTGPLIASQNNINPIFSPKIQLISTSTPTYTLETDTFPREVTFYDTSFTSSLPTPNNVRSGSIYGGSNQFSGSMIIPSASNVRYGVPVDTVTGSATLTPQDILNYATQNLTGSNTVGARLKNIATTQTTAATIAAFKGK
jgi:hypothetical protein